MNRQPPSFHGDFTAALVAPDPDARPAGLDDIAARRFAIYRNNVHRGLGDALAAAYPVVQRLVGDEFFRATARAFFLGEPRRAPSLALYGEGFADFLADFTPAQSLPYLADLARLERAWLEAFHAADADPLSPSALREAGDGLSSLRLVPHPATRLITSPYPIVSIWQANRDERAAPAAIAARSEAALITRPGYEVSVTPLNRGAALFAASLFAGTPAGSAAEQAMAALGDFNIAAAFSTLLGSGAFLHIIQGD